MPDRNARKVARQAALEGLLPEELQDYVLGLCRSGTLAESSKKLLWFLGSELLPERPSAIPIDLYDETNTWAKELAECGQQALVAAALPIGQLLHAKWAEFCSRDLPLERVEAAKTWLRERSPQARKRAAGLGKPPSSALWGEILDAVLPEREAHLQRWHRRVSDWIPPPYRYAEILSRHTAGAAGSTKSASALKRLEAALKALREYGDRVALHSDVTYRLQGLSPAEASRQATERDAGFLTLRQEIERELFGLALAELQPTRDPSGKAAKNR